MFYNGDLKVDGHFKVGDAVAAPLPDMEKGFRYNFKYCKDNTETGEQDCKIATNE